MGVCVGEVRRVYTTDDGDPPLVLVAFAAGDLPREGRTVMITEEEEPIPQV